MKEMVKGGIQEWDRLGNVWDNKGRKRDREKRREKFLAQLLVIYMNLYVQQFTDIHIRPGIVHS